MFKRELGFGLIELIVAIVVIAVLAGAGYLFVQNMNNQADTDNDDVSSSESATVDDDTSMEDWKTYSSQKYGFTFKYPEDWMVEESTVETFPDQPNAIVKNESGEEVLGVYGYLGTGCEETASGDEPTEQVTVASTEVVVAKDCNANWNWIKAEAEDGSDLVITTAGFLDTSSENKARELLKSVTGLTAIVAN